MWFKQYPYEIIQGIWQDGFKTMTKNRGVQIAIIIANNYCELAFEKICGWHIQLDTEEYCKAIVIGVIWVQ